jgi:hypothetical protein
LFALFSDGVLLQIGKQRGVVYDHGNNQTVNVFSILGGGDGAS